MARLAAATARRIAGILLLAGLALPATAQISGFKVSVVDTHGLEVHFDLTAYAVAYNGPYIKAGFPLDNAFSTVYTTSYDFGFGYSGGTNYVVTFTSQENWNTTNPAVVTFGDGNHMNAFVLVYEGSPAVTRRDGVQPGTSVYRGSFVHSYPSPGTYSISAQLTPDGDSATPGLASTGNTLAYPPTTGSAVVGTLTKVFNSLFRVARTVAPSSPLTSVNNTIPFSYGPTVRYLVNQSGPFTIDNLPGLDIKTPNDNSNFGSDTNIELTGASFDPEDGEISGMIDWFSDLDGPLGTGAAVVVQLSPGMHTLTATVSDSIGNVVFDQAAVNVAAGGPTLAATAGICPGIVSLQVTGLSPGDKVAFYTGLSPGHTVLPGACAGAIIDLDSAQRRSTRFADGAGEILLNRFFSVQQCALLTQVVNIGVAGSACQTSNVLPTPVPALNNPLRGSGGRP